MRTKVFWGVLVLAMAALIGIFVIANNSGSDTDNNNQNVSQEITSQDHVYGNPQGKNTLVEYADYQCPSCAQASPILDELSKKQKDLRIVYRHFPITAIHPNAFPAARAAEAAGAQGKFFEMSTILYSRQSEWAENPNALAKFREYATELKLDIEKFNEAYNSQATTDRINRDIAIARQLEVEGTPTFYLNNKKFENQGNYDDFLAEIKKATKANQE